jgi:hypothetical protein
MCDMRPRAPAATVPDGRIFLDSAASVFVCRRGAPFARRRSATGPPVTHNCECHASYEPRSDV